MGQVSIILLLCKQSKYDDALLVSAAWLKYSGRSLTSNTVKEYQKAAVTLFIFLRDSITSNVLDNFIIKSEETIEFYLEMSKRLP